MRKNKIVLCSILCICILCVNICSVWANISDKPIENFANVVFFAYYNGTEDEMNADIEYYKNKSKELIDVYNGNYKRSLTNYLKEISYGKFNIKNIFPQLKNGVIEPLKLELDIKNSYTRNDDINLINQVISAYPSIGNEIVDYDGDGFIDNLTIIIKCRDGYEATDNSTFISHKADYPAPQKYLNKTIGTYNVIGTKSIENDKAGVIAHEFLHSLGYPDLYRTNNNDYPVYVWDIMASANYGMSYPLAILRNKFTNWINIDTITENATLRLDLQSNKDGNQAFILKSPLNDYEYFVVEYRKKGNGVDENVLDRFIGGSGVIVYRVDTTVTGLSNFFGDTGIYIFRPQTGFDSENQKINNAFLSLESGRTSIGLADLNKGLKDGALTYKDGSNSGIVIKNVSSAGGNYMTLDVEIPKKEDFDVWNNVNYNDLTNSDEYTIKNMAITKYKNTLYSVSYTNGKLYTQAYENNIWQTKNITSDSNIEVLSPAKLIEMNDEMYLITKNSNKILIYKWINDKWNLFSAYSAILNEFDVNVINNKLYIVASLSDKAMLFTLDQKTLNPLGTYYTGANGSPKVANIGNTVYVSIKDIQDNVLLYKYNNGSFNNVNINLNTNTYDLKTLNNQIYILLGSSNGSTLSLKKFDGSSSIETIDSNLKLTFPNLVVSQGNLYMLGISNNNLYVYSYDENTKLFEMEGNIVDTSSSNYNTQLVSVNDTIYVGIKRDRNMLLIKSKQTVNNLLSLSIVPPNKVSYVVGEKIDKTGLKVYANYVKNQVQVENYTIENFDTSTPGQHNAIITYEGVSQSFNYEVFEKISNENQESLKDGQYVIRSAANTDLVLDASGGYAKNETNLILYKYAKNKSNQIWNVKNLGNGYYTISSYIDESKNLDVYKGHNTKGTNVQLYRNNGGTNQQWLLKYLGDGYYEIIAKESGLVLDAAGVNPTSGANISVWTRNNGKNQKFKFEEIADASNIPKKTLNDGKYVIRSVADTNLVLDASGGYAKNETNVIVYQYGKGKKNQTWMVKFLGNGYYIISSCVDENMNLDVYKGYNKKGTNVQLYRNNGGANQQWIIKDIGNDNYEIITKGSGLTLDAEGVLPVNKANISVWTRNNGKNQKFIFEKCP